MKLPKEYLTDVLNGDEINIPFSVTQIGNRAFANGLSGINISSNISNISADAFTGTSVAINLTATDR